MARKQDPLSVEFLLLGLIWRKPIHAYDLNKLLSSDNELKLIWHFNQSQLYAVLDKIEKNNLIRSEISSGSAFPFRKIFSLTEFGVQMFNEWLKAPVEHVNELRSDFMAKLYFLKDQPLEAYQSTINAQISYCDLWKDSLQSHYDQTTEKDTYLRMLYDFRLRSCQATKEWLEACLKMRQ